MAVKNLRGGLDTLLGEADTETEITVNSRGKAAVEITTKNKEAPKKPERESEIRATFIVRESRIEQLKAIAYWDRAKIKDVHNAALEMYIESRKGDIPKVLANRAEKRR